MSDLTPIETALLGLGGGIALTLLTDPVKWFLKKYVGKIDSTDTKVSSLEGAIGGVSDKSFEAIDALTKLTETYNSERKEQIKTLETHLSTRIDDLKEYMRGKI